jgi:hypothetical protein
MSLERELRKESRLDLRAWHIEPDLERAFLIAPIDREHTMRRYLRERF